MAAGAAAAAADGLMVWLRAQRKQQGDSGVRGPVKLLSPSSVVRLRLRLQLLTTAPVSSLL